MELPVTEIGLVGQIISKQMKFLQNTLEAKKKWKKSKKARPNSERN